MTEIHLVMLRYTMDGSPLEEAEDYGEQVRFACADLANAELIANQMELDNPEIDTQYFVRSHSVISVVS